MTTSQKHLKKPVLKMAETLFVKLHLEYNWCSDIVRLQPFNGSSLKAGDYNV